MARPSKEQQNQQGTQHENRRLTGAETDLEERDSPQPPIRKRSGKLPYDPYTADGYEAGPDEWNDVHVEIERREFDADGSRISVSTVYKTNVNQFRAFLKYRNGYSINKVLHRPGTMEPFEADQWKNRKL